MKKYRAFLIGHYTFRLTALIWLLITWVSATQFNLTIIKTMHYSNAPSAYLMGGTFVTLTMFISSWYIEYRINSLHLKTREVSKEEWKE